MILVIFLSALYFGQFIADYFIKLCRIKVNKKKTLFKFVKINDSVFSPRLGLLHSEHYGAYHHNISSIFLEFIYEYDFSPFDINNVAIFSSRNIKR